MVLLLLLYENEKILCVGFVTADLSWNFSVIWYVFREYFSTSDQVIHLCMLRSEWFIIAFYIFYNEFQTIQCRNMALQKKSSQVGWIISEWESSSTFNSMRYVLANLFRYLLNLRPFGIFWSFHWSDQPWFASIHLCKWSKTF